MTEEQRLAARQRIDKVLEELGEHFDSVQILASVTHAHGDGGGTSTIARGSGNFMARIQHAREWVEDYDTDRKERVRQAAREES